MIGGRYRKENANTKYEAIKPKNSISIVFSIILLIILLASFTSAEISINTYNYNNDFLILQGPDIVKTCSCASNTDSVVIQNSGNYAAVFSVGTDTDLSGRLRLSDKSFALDPGQSKQITIYYDAECSKMTKQYALTVISSLGVQKSIVKKLLVDKCQNIELWIYGNNQTVKPCSDSKFTIFVKNSGPFAEEYLLTSNKESFTSFSTNSFTLQPNQIAQVNADVKMSCNIYGDQSVEFSAKSIKNNLIAKIVGQYTIESDYDYNVVVNSQIANDVSAPASIDVCNRQTNFQVPITITNNGVDNQFSLEFKDLPKFMKVSGLVDNKISLRRFESKTFNIDINTLQFRSEVNNYQANFIVRPSFGDIIQTESVLNFNVKPCHDVSVKILDYTTAEKPLQTCAQNFYNYEIELKNNGAFPENVDLSLDNAPNGVDLSRKSILVGVNESTKLKLYIIGPESSESSNIKLTAKYATWYNEYDDLWIRSYDKQQCHMISFEKNEFKVNYDDKYITTNIKNEGLVEGNYNILWFGERILKPTFTQVYINKSTSTTLTLELNSSGLNESTYKGTLYITHPDSNSTYSKEFSVTLKDKTLIRKGFEFLAFGNMCRQVSLGFIVAIICAVLLTLFFIFKGPHYPYKFWNRVKSKLPILVVLIALWLLGVLLVVLIAGWPVTQQQVYNFSTNASQLRFEWLSNDKYQLDVSKYFVSPENLTMKYKIKEMQNIKTTADGSIITFYPDYGWSGIRNTTITAYDDYGGSLESPRITLSVLNVPRKSTIELYSIYCEYANLGAYAILLAIIFLMVIVKQKRRTRK